ncbi:hypothetical protein K458DRAFT_455659 [Lentithecium fluviatile CBS 122367]|uniref:Uncharacterized protein n=1 Tax=Lentithecium fluviatile CBS 122367 TaxID=1168545 RepID=A0A6G1JL61_9PLEO|nr:hypothetical protein K458DRAFT_455659 [Lentithecium fluviatile CBS 122367]
MPTSSSGAERLHEAGPVAIGWSADPVSSRSRSAEMQRTPLFELENEQILVVIVLFVAYLLRFGTRLEVVSKMRLVEDVNGASLAVQMRLDPDVEHGLPLEAPHIGHTLYSSPESWFLPLQLTDGFRYSDSPQSFVPVSSACMNTSSTYDGCDQPWFTSGIASLLQTPRRLASADTFAGTSSNVEGLDTVSSGPGSVADRGGEPWSTKHSCSSVGECREDFGWEYWQAATSSASDGIAVQIPDPSLLGVGLGVGPCKEEYEDDRATVLEFTDKTSYASGLGSISTLWSAELALDAFGSQDDGSQESSPPLLKDLAQLPRMENILERTNAMFGDKAVDKTIEMASASAEGDRLYCFQSQCDKSFRRPCDLRYACTGVDWITS